MLSSSTPLPYSPRRLDVPGRAVGRDLPGVTLVLDHLLGPALADDVEVLFERGSVGGVDRVVVARMRRVDAVDLLGQRVHPAALVAARKAGQRPAAGHVIEHGDVLGHADRILRRQHQPKLAHADPLGLHRQVEVEHDRIRRDLEALNMEMVLGEPDRVVPQRVPGLRKRREVLEHVLIQLRTIPGHPGLNVLASADRW